MNSPPVLMISASSTTMNNVSAPERFSFASSEEWPKWKRRFERYRTVSELASRPENEQVCLLIYFMGDEADDILLSFNLTDEEIEEFETVVNAFDNYFIGKRNVIYERAKFNLRNQEEGESVAEFITALHNQTQHCQYGVLIEEMIRDRIVVGLT